MRDETMTNEMDMVNTETKEGKMLNVALEMLMFEERYKKLKPSDLVELIEQRAEVLFK